MKFEQHTFEDQDVLLDANQFVDCTFIRCKLIYMGISVTNLGARLIKDCTWEFAGPAANTVNFMANLYNVGGSASEMIANTLDNIKAGIGTKH